MRRLLLALTLSLAAHAAFTAGFVAYGLFGALAFVPKVKMDPVAIDLTRELPLGAPPEKAAPPEEEPPVHRRARKPRVAHSSGDVVVKVAPDAGVSTHERDAGIAEDLLTPDGGGVGGLDGGRRRPGDLRNFGPSGSRLIALLRLDRLRASPAHEKLVAALDELLLLLPDRRVLLDGSGLDLYRDFDSLLIATPDPRDASVTFLVARHHLPESALRAGLERGAKAARRSIVWRTVDGRPVGIRQQVPSSPGTPLTLDRDDRILVLPHPGLAILATPAYAVQLLGQDALAVPGSARPIDAGAADAGAAMPSPKPSRVRWSDIVARIDAEDNAMPDDAVFLLTAASLFASASPPDLVLPPTRGANEDMPAHVARAPGSTLPRTLTLVAGLEAPFLDLVADFESEAEAEAWERDLPKWKRRLLLNPLVLLGGLSSLVDRIQTTREGAMLDLRIESSIEEVQRLLNLGANLTRAARARPR